MSLGSRTGRLRTLCAVALVPHSTHPIGVVIGEDNSSLTIFKAQTAASAWRITQFDIQSNGKAIVRFSEGIGETVVVRVGRQVNGEKSKDDSGEEDEGDEERSEERR